MGFEEATALSALGGGAELFSGVFALLGDIVGFIGNVFLLSLLGLVLYYYTGDKKKADEFMPSIMRLSVRVTSFVWSGVAAIVAFLGLNSMLHYIFDEVLPGDNGYFDVESETFVRGLVMVLVAVVIFALHYAINFMIETAEEKKGTVATKYFVTFGLILFSIIFFVSFMTMVNNWVDVAYDDAPYVSSGNVATTLAGGLFWAIYMFLANKLMKNEPKDEK